MQSKRPLILPVAALTLVFGLLTTSAPLFAADKEKVLRDFGPGPDASFPRAALISDAGGNLYGTTFQGGDQSCGYNTGCGTVFRLTPIGNATWMETVLHSFNGEDGYSPWASLIRDAGGWPNQTLQIFSGCPAQASLGRGCSVVTEPFAVAN
jgi:uncharacterized repeat protein (TIGR03803 family)